MPDEGTASEVEVRPWEKVFVEDLSREKVFVGLMFPPQGVH